MVYHIVYHSNKVEVGKAVKYASNVGSEELVRENKVINMKFQQRKMKYVTYVFLLRVSF
jgi:diketogulonate reductase-like aldo/keto reductase